MAVLTTLNAASPLNASDNTYLTFTADSTETLNRALDNVDADFASMDSLTFNVEYSVTAVPADDTYQLSIRIVDGATILAAANAGGTSQVIASNITSTTDTNSGAVAFTYVNTGATKTQWNNATVELTQTYAKTKGSDGVSIRVDQVIFDGVYTAGAIEHTGTGAIDSTVPTTSGTGLIEKTGTGAISTPIVTTSGAGTLSRSGTGAISTPLVTTSGTGTCLLYTSPSPRD